MDISETTAPRSDQQNYDDFIGGPKTVAISEVKRGSKEQPVEVHLVEYPGRPFKPSKSMRRVMVAAWGGEASTYVGRSLRLYGDPTVRFGGQEVGGIKISHMSHLNAPVVLQLTVSRSKREEYTVLPLVTVDAAAGWLRAATTLAELQKAWTALQHFGLGGVGDLADLKDARKGELATKESKEK